MTAVAELAASNDASLGQEELYVAEAYLIRAMPDHPGRSPDGRSSSIADWPPDAPVRLADAADCVDPRASVAEVLAGANQLTCSMPG